MSLQDCVITEGSEQPIHYEHTRELKQGRGTPGLTFVCRSCVQPITLAKPSGRGCSNDARPRPQAGRVSISAFPLERSRHNPNASERRPFQLFRQKRPRTSNNVAAEEDKFMDRDQAFNARKARTERIMQRSPVEYSPGLREMFHHNLRGLLVPIFLFLSRLQPSPPHPTTMYTYWHFVLLAQGK